MIYELFFLLSFNIGVDFYVHAAWLSFVIKSDHRSLLQAFYSKKNEKRILRKAMFIQVLMSYLSVEHFLF